MNDDNPRNDDEGGVDQAEQVRRMVLRLMLEKVHGDRFPSSTQLDIIERLLTPREQPLYVEVLMAKVSEDTYPSLDLIRRMVEATESA